MFRRFSLLSSANPVRLRTLPARIQLFSSVSVAPASASATIVPVAPRAVGYWLAGCAGMVFGMVVLGGATRLTKSGLSMVEWKPHTFTKPSTPQEWEAEFEKYKQFPEYKRVNKDMTVDDFKVCRTSSFASAFWALPRSVGDDSAKCARRVLAVLLAETVLLRSFCLIQFIYMMEWGHRQWGRLIGLAFVGPAVVFAGRKMIPSALLPRVLGMLALGGAQGAVGWWMVKSGLEEKLLHNPAEPRVSPYRLAVHVSAQPLVLPPCA